MGEGREEREGDLGGKEERGRERESERDPGEETGRC